MISSTTKMLCLLIAVTMTWLCGSRVVAATPVGGSDLTPEEASSSEILTPNDQETSGLVRKQIPVTLNNDTLSDRAELVLSRFSWLLGLPPLKMSNFFIINEYNGWQIVRQSFCDTGKWEDISNQKVIEYDFLFVIRVGSKKG